MVVYMAVAFKAVMLKRGACPNLGKPGGKNGATARNRTADILITSEVLCRLSYGGS